MIANGDYSGVGNFTAPILNSGLGPYLYTPPKIPMGVGDWPTLSNMILTGKRVVIFMDYQANQTAVPYILDQFSQMWETPFDPTNITFPCVVDRPPRLTRQQALDRMYMINHNLNLEINYLGVQLFIPNLAYLNVTNGVSGLGSLGASVNGCVGMFFLALAMHAYQMLTITQSRLGSPAKLAPGRLLQLRQSDERLRLPSSRATQRRHVQPQMLRYGSSIRRT